MFRPCGVGRRPAQRRDNSAAASFWSTWQHTWLTRNLPVGAGGAWGAPRNLGSTTTVNAKWAGRVAGCCQQDKGPTLGQALKVRLFPFFPVVSATGFWGAQTRYGFRRQYGRRIGRSWSLRRNLLKGTLVCGKEGSSDMAVLHPNHSSFEESADAQRLRVKAISGIWRWSS